MPNAPSAPFRFATLTSTARWGGGAKKPVNNQQRNKSTKFISGLDPGGLPENRLRVKIGKIR